MIHLIVLSTIYALFTVSALVLMRMGGGISIAFLNASLSLSLPVKVIAGLVFYVLGFVVYVAIIPRLTFTRTFPILNGSVYILIVLSGIFIFREKITIQHLLGIGMILVGALILGFTNQN